MTAVRAAGLRATVPRTLAVRVFAGATVVTLLVFGVCAALGVDLGGGFDGSGAGVAVAAGGVGLLAVDAVAPVPSLAVIAGLGAAFGVVAGSLLALVGLVAGSALAYLCGSVVRTRAGVRAAEPGQGRTVSAWSLVLLRGVPVLAEAAAASAGAAGLRWRRFALLAVVGAAPVALLGTLLGDSFI